jgi:hypothetical protein
MTAFFTKTGESRWWGGSAIVAYLALVKLVLHLATAKVYGFFIDELYFPPEPPCSNAGQSDVEKKDGSMLRDQAFHY